MNIRDLQDMVGEKGKYKGKRLEIQLGRENLLGEREVIFKSLKYGWTWRIIVDNSLDVTYFDLVLKKEGYRTYEDLARELVGAKEELGSWKILKSGYVILTDQKIINEGKLSMLVLENSKDTNGWVVEVDKAAICGILSRDLFFEWMQWRDAMRAK